MSEEKVEMPVEEGADAPAEEPVSPYLDALTGPPDLGAVLDQPPERVTQAEGRPGQP